MKNFDPMPDRAFATLVLPCLDEARALRWLLPRVPRGYDVIVVDNGSTDGSGDVARRWGAQVVGHPVPHQVGRCVEIGVSQAETDIVCVMDCDGTVDPGDTVSLVTPILDGAADFVVGARRMMGSSRSRMQIAQSSARDRLLRVVEPDWPFRDLGSARAFRRSAFTTHAILNSRYAWNLDSTARAFENSSSSRLAEVEIPHLPRIGKSKISGAPTGRLLAATDHLRVIAGMARRKANAVDERDLERGGGPGLVPPRRRTPAPAVSRPARATRS